MTCGRNCLTVVTSSLASSATTLFFLFTEILAEHFSFAANDLGVEPHSFKYRLPLFNVCSAVVPLVSYKEQKLKHRQHTNTKMAVHNSLNSDNARQT